jgi:hypothetical protein
MQGYVSQALSQERYSIVIHLSFATYIGVGSGIGHAQDARSGMLELKVFVGKLAAVDTLSSGTIVVGKVTSLTHESRNDTMKAAPGKTEALLAGTERPKVLGRLGNDVAAKFHDDTSSGLAANGNVKVNLGKGPKERKKERE